MKSTDRLTIRAQSTHSTASAISRKQMVLKWESELLSAKLKSGIHGYTNTHIGRFLFQRVEVQSSQHRHWGWGDGGEECLETAEIRTVYTFANIDQFIFGRFRGLVVCNP